MCQLCDQPDLSVSEYLAGLRREIDVRRFTTVSVAGDRRIAEFSYTTGLTEHGLPELVVTGLRPLDAVRLLDLWGDYLLDTSAVLPGETLETGPWRLEAVVVDAPGEVLGAAAALYGEQLRALQLVWASPSGRWPWDAGYRRVRPAGQPVLGPRSPHYCREHDPGRLDVPDGLDGLRLDGEDDDRDGPAA